MGVHRSLAHTVWLRRVGLAVPIGVGVVLIRMATETVRTLLAALLWMGPRLMSNTAIRLREQLTISGMMTRHHLGIYAWWTAAMIRLFRMTG